MGRDTRPLIKVPQEILVEQLLTRATILKKETADLHCLAWQVYMLSPISSFGLSSEAVMFLNTHDLRTLGCVIDTSEDTLSKKYQASPEIVSEIKEMLRSRGLRLTSP
jgi:hypothetical protein